jgi:hypothetical protein
MLDRRQFLQGAAASGAVLYINGFGVVPRALAAVAAEGLSDFATQDRDRTERA